MPAQTVIKVRRDTAANWISADPTLASGEIGFETDTNQLKIGNGTSAWTVLPYASGAGGASVEISETAPADPEEGDVWFNSTDGRAYIYYDSTWVDLNPGIAGPIGPAGIVASTTEPSDTSVVWLDTDEVPDVPVPAGGTTGQVLSKIDTADYNTEWSTLPEAPSGNVIINGAFEINQRKLTSTPGITFFSASFGTDRWINYLDYHSNFSYQSLNESTVPTINSLRLGSVSMDNPYPYRLSVGQKIEDLNTYNLRGKTVTLSFYIKFNSSTFTSSFGPTPFNNFRYEIGYNTSTTNSAFRVSGHPDIPTSIADSYNFSTITNGFLPTTWTRITLTGTVPSTANNIHVGFGFEGAGYTITNNELNYEITGVQLEAGNVATPFRRNAPSIQAELAACQRYYFRIDAKNNKAFALGQAYSSTNALGYATFPVTMRSEPTALEQSGTAANYGVLTANTTSNACTAVPIFDKSTLFGSSFVFIASGLVAGNASHLVSRNDSAYLAWSAEL